MCPSRKGIRLSEQSILETSTSKRRARTPLTDVKPYDEDDDDNNDSVAGGYNIEFMTTVIRKEEKGKNKVQDKSITIHGMNAAFISRFLC